MDKLQENNRRHIAEQAAEWFVSLRDSAGDRSVNREEQHRQFMEWMLDSPVHVHEYLEVAQTWGDLADVDPHAEIDIGSLASRSAKPAHVVALDQERIEKKSADASVPKKTVWRHFALAASLVMAVAVGLFGWNQYSSPQEVFYNTGLGEQRSVILEDGSSLELNTLSEVAVLFAAGERRIRLIKGEALFDVQHNPERPFFVEAGPASVQVIGTRFNIYRKVKGTKVTVLDGLVEVTPDNSDQSGTGNHEPIKLRRSQQAYISRDLQDITVSMLDDVRDAIAWTDRKLIFDSRPLSEIVAEFNRYNSRRLVLKSLDLQQVKLSGVFNSNDLDSLLEFIERIRKIEVSEMADGSLAVYAR